MFWSQFFSCLQLEDGEDGKGITLPDSHPLLEYAKSNSRWLKNIELEFTHSPDGPLSEFTVQESPVVAAVPKSRASSSMLQLLQFLDHKQLEVLNAIGAYEPRWASPFMQTDSKESLFRSMAKFTRTSTSGQRSRVPGLN